MVGQCQESIVAENSATEQYETNIDWTSLVMKTSELETMETGKRHGPGRIVF